LQGFFEALPPRLGASFVVIVHLDPNHRSELAAVLSRSTKMHVVQVDHRVDIEPDTVYVIPPDRRLRISDGAIETARFDEPRACLAFVVTGASRGPFPRPPRRCRSTRAAALAGPH
jgi:two-component system CheB/CheR fusion protein